MIGDQWIMADYMNKFKVDDRIRVAEDFFWAKGAAGTISEHPVSREGDELTRIEDSELGKHRVYWVWFDIPQFDAEGDGPYRAGQIWESALSLL